MRRIAAFVLAVLVAAIAEGAAQDPDQELVDHWQELLIAADEAIQSKNYEQAEELAQALLDAFDERLAGGSGAKKFYAAALVRRSLAAAGLDRLAEAQWDWDVAREFLPSEIPDTTFDPARTQPETVFLLDDEGVIAPVVLHREPPRYTAAALDAHLNGTVAFDFILSREGQLRSPALTWSADPGLDFAALEAIRRWRFQPAEFAGKPVAVLYSVTVQFQIVVRDGRSLRLVPPSLDFPLRYGDSPIDPAQSRLRD